MGDPGPPPNTRFFWAHQTWNWVTFCDPAPVDPVTLFYNELQMSTYVADKRLQWTRGLPVFIAV